MAETDRLDKWIRFLMTVAVLGVGAFAFIISYSHIYDLGHSHGQYGVAGRLLPLSVDGLILAASLVLLHEARRGHRPPASARWLLGLGVAATVGANVAYGVAFGALGAVISAWPPAAFVGTVEMGMHLLRAGRSAPARGAEAAVMQQDEPGFLRVPAPTLADYFGDPAYREDHPPLPGDYAGKENSPAGLPGHAERKSQGDGVTGIGLAPGRAF
jgi:hypothetical protein